MQPPVDDRICRSSTQLVASSPRLTTPVTKTVAGNLGTAVPQAARSQLHPASPLSEGITKGMRLLERNVLEYRRGSLSLLADGGLCRFSPQEGEPVGIVLDLLVHTDPGRVAAGKAVVQQDRTAAG